MDTSQWSQEVGLVNGLEGNNGTGTCSKPTVERKVRAHVQNTEQAMNCPRCSSTNTKFCYYNNYSLSQPRYLCKTCRRYWTEGGSLRNIPVGGGSRKNRRSSTSSSSSAAAASSHKLIPDLNPPTLSHFSSQNTKIHGGQDLNLGFSATQDYHYGFPHQFVKLPKAENNDANSHHISSSSSTPHSLSALDLLRTGIACGGLTSFLPMPMPMPDSNTLYTPVFPLQESKPALSFSADGSGTRYGSSFHGVQENGTARVMLPFGAPKEFQSSSEADDQTKGQANSTGYWNGRLGGEAW